MQKTTSEATVIAVPPPRAGRLLEEVRAEHSALIGQLDALRREHRDIRVELSRMPDGAERRIQGERIGELDERIRLVEKQLEVNVLEMGEAVPQTATVVEVPPHYAGEPHLLDLPKEYVILGGLFMLVTLLPLSVALARRMWHRSTPTVAAAPAELVERMNRMEHIVEATALEMERIGEGQRFMTSLLSENMAASRNIAAPAQRAANPPYRGAQRDALPGGDSPLPGMITPV
jgi:hypothetical protein